MMGARAAAGTLVLAFCLVSPAQALDVPALTGRVVDQAGVLTPDRVAAITAKLEALEHSDSTQVAVLIIPTLEGESLEAYSLRVVDRWKLGQAGRDNGVLLLVAMQEHDLRIEVGYGLEARLPDITAGKIIRNEMVPRFRDNDYAGGIDAGVDAIIRAVKGEYEGTGQPSGSLSQEGPGTGALIFGLLALVVSSFLARIKRLFGGAAGAVIWMIGGFLFLGAASWLLILLLIPVLFGVGMISPEVLQMAVRAGVSGAMRSGGSGGGFSGGGGRFGGGGASGKW